MLLSGPAPYHQARQASQSGDRRTFGAGMFGAYLQLPANCLASVAMHAAATCTQARARAYSRDRGRSQPFGALPTGWEQSSGSHHSRTADTAAGTPTPQIKPTVPRHAPKQAGPLHMSVPCTLSDRVQGLRLPNGRSATTLARSGALSAVQLQRSNTAPATAPSCAR